MCADLYFMEPHVIPLYEVVDANLARRLAQQLTGPDRPTAIQLRIHSPGGEVYSGFAIYHLLQSLRREGVYVEAVVDGLAASMASIIALAAERVIMADNARMLLHNPWTFAEGDSATLQQSATQLAELQAQLVAVYTQRTGLPADRIQALMDQERYLSPREARELNLIDAIVPAVLALARRPSRSLRPLALYQAYLPTADAAPSKLEAKAFDKLAKLEADLQARELALATDQAQLLRTQAHWLAERAVAEGRLSPGLQDTILRLAQHSYPDTVALLQALPARQPQPGILEQLTQAFHKAKDTAAGHPTDRTEWTFRDWEKRDPDALARLRTSDPSHYQALFHATYQPVT